MKKTLIAVALVSAFSLAQAQSTPANTVAVTTNGQPVPAATAAAPQVPLSSGDLKAGSANMNPYTGVSKETEIDAKKIEALKFQKDMSSQKLQLQRDELDALRIEVEKKKLYDTLNPPQPAPEPKPVKKVERPKPVVIYPEASKNELPVLVGVATVGQNKVAMFEHDGRALPATVGSIIAGKKIEDIGVNSVRWGSQYLNISNKKGFATVALNENEGPIERKKNANAGSSGLQQVSAQSSSSSSSSAPASSTPTLPGTNIPMISPKGAAAPSGVFGLLPPPPPSASK